MFDSKIERSFDLNFAQGTNDVPAGIFFFTFKSLLRTNKLRRRKGNAFSVRN